VGDAASASVAVCLSACLSSARVPSVVRVCAPVVVTWWLRGGDMVVTWWLHTCAAAERGEGAANHLEV
jgi:hypothetical protein